MTTYYLGELTIGGALPGVSAVALAGVAGINAALPDILSRIAALSAFSPQPVNFAASLALAESIVTSITTSIALGIPPPSIAAQIAAVLALVSDLLAQVTAIHGQLEVIADFQALLGTAGIHAFAFDSPAGSFGAELDSEISISTPITGATHCNAIVLLTTIPAAWTALTSITVGP